MKFKIAMIIIALFVSCNKINQDIVDVETIDFTQGLNNHKSIFLSDIAQSIRYVKLETNNKCLLKDIEKIKKYKDKLIVGNRKSIFIFNENGGFVKKIGDYGKGSGEYLDVDDFDVSTENGDIFILDSGNKQILQFSIEGKYIFSFKLDAYPRAISIFNNSIITSFVRPEYYHNDLFSFNTYSTSGILQRKTFKRDATGINNNNVDKMPTTSRVRLDLFNDTLTYWEVNLDFVYRIGNDGNAIKRYYLKNEFQPSLKEHNSSKIIKNNYQFSYYLESSRYMFFLLGAYKSKPINMYYDKVTRECVDFTYNSNYGKEQLMFGFKNDIDGGYPFLPEGVLSKDELYSVFFGFELKGLLKRKDFYELNIKDAFGNENIKKIADEAQLTDNHIVMIVKMKEK